VAGLIEETVTEKIALSLAGDPFSATARNTPIPTIKGKAIAVIGMRRAGKTTFLHQIRAYLIAQGRDPDSLLYFNFEDERLGNMKADQLRLVPEIYARLAPEAHKNGVVLFLDEIQLIDGWESFARRLLDTPGYELYLSGSSAKLLSREIATSMRGRGWEVEIHPFSFGEWMDHHGHQKLFTKKRLTAKDQAALDHHFAKYLQQGGFPEAQGLDPTSSRLLIQGYVDVLLFRDVIERHQVTNVTALRWMVRRLLSSPAGNFSVSKYAEDLKSQGISVSRDTLHEYLAHLQDTFLLHALTIATDSEKRRQVNPRKVYPADPGLISVFDRSGKANTGARLETLVLIELYRRRCEVNYVKTKKGYEVDFHSINGLGGLDLYQVCVSLDDPETREREVRALLDAAREFPEATLTILTAEHRLHTPDIPESITVLPAWQWMREGPS